MKSRVIIFGIIFLTVVNLAALATFAYYRICSHDSPRNCPAQNLQADVFLQKKLDLSDAQLIRMRHIRSRHHEQTEDIIRRLTEKKLHLSRLVMTQTHDTTQINAVLGQIDSLQSKMQRRVVNHLIAQREILTTGQQELFSSMVMNCCAANTKKTNHCITNDHNP